MLRASQTRPARMLHRAAARKREIARARAWLVGLIGEEVMGCLEAFVGVWVGGDGDCVLVDVAMFVGLQFSPLIDGCEARCLGFPVYNVAAIRWCGERSWRSAK
jgi:hypothetical protein